jgi:hypothetical protein
MFKLLKIPPTLSCALVLVITVGLTWLLGRFVCDQNGPNYSAWAQGVGTVLAVVVALWTFLTGEQRKSEARKKSVIAIADTIGDYCKNLRDLLDTEEPRLGLASICDKSILIEFARALENFPVHELGSSEAVSAFLMLHRSLPFLEDRIEKYLHMPEKNPDRDFEKEYQGLPAEERNRREHEAIRSWEQVNRRNIRTMIDATERYFSALKTALNS